MKLKEYYSNSTTEIKRVKEGGAKDERRFCKGCGKGRAHFEDFFNR
jgi:hypothetical protein